MIIFMILAIAALGQLMVYKGARTGHYVNPNVATQVVRGTIFDRNGRALAIEVPRYNVYADFTTKAESADLNAASQVLAIYTDKTPAEMYKLLQDTQTERKLIAHDIPLTTVDALKSALLHANIPSDVITITKEYERTYPAAFHAAQLIDETEQVFDHVLSPYPGFDELTTYGSDVYLSIDLDIQYLLDLAVQQVYDIQKSDYSLAFIADVTTGQVLACTTYPFYDLNNTKSVPEEQRISQTYVSSISRADLQIQNLQLISKVTKHNSTDPVTDYKLDKPYTTDLELTRDLVTLPDGINSQVKLIPDTGAKYLIFIGSINPTANTDSNVLDLAIDSIRQGLASQGKL